MTPLERLTAAIARLELLKVDTSPPEKWEHRSYKGGSSWSSPGYLGDLAERWPRDVELITTLHRTIDAQLAILRAAVGRIPRFFDAMVNAHGDLDNEPGPYYRNPEKAWDNIRYHYRNELALATAILNEGD